MTNPESPSNKLGTALEQELHGESELAAALGTYVVKALFPPMPRQETPETPPPQEVTTVPIEAMWTPEDETFLDQNGIDPGDTVGAPPEASAVDHAKIPHTVPLAPHETTPGPEA